VFQMYDFIHMEFLEVFNTELSHKIFSEFPVVKVVRQFYHLKP